MRTHLRFGMLRVQNRPCQEPRKRCCGVAPKAAKLAAVLGTSPPYSPSTTRPRDLPPASRSKKTFWVTSGSAKALQVRLVFSMHPDSRPESPSQKTLEFLCKRCAAYIEVNSTFQHLKQQLQTQKLIRQNGGHGRWPARPRLAHCAPAVGASAYLRRAHAH